MIQFGKDTRIIHVLEITEAPENGHIGLKASSHKKVAGSIAQLRCIYTNAYSMGNKEELEAIMQQQNHYIVASTDTWWDDSHNWSAALKGYKLFRRRWDSPEC